MYDLMFEMSGITVSTRRYETSYGTPFHSICSLYMFEMCINPLRGDMTENVCESALQNYLSSLLGCHMFKMPHIIFSYVRHEKACEIPLNISRNHLTSYQLLIMYNCVFNSVVLENPYAVALGQYAQLSPIRTDFHLLNVPNLVFRYDRHENACETSQTSNRLNMSSYLMYKMYNNFFSNGLHENACEISRKRIRPNSTSYLMFKMYKIFFSCGLRENACEVPPKIIRHNLTNCLMFNPFTTMCRFSDTFFEFFCRHATLLILIQFYSNLRSREVCSFSFLGKKTELIYL